MLNRKVFLASLTALLVITFCYFMYWHPSSRHGSINYNNIKKVKEGMPVEEMLRIMGRPDTVFDDQISIYSKDSGKVYFYNLGFASADGINVIVDREGRVKGIVLEE